MVLAVTYEQDRLATVLASFQRFPGLFKRRAQVGAGARQASLLVGSEHQLRQRPGVSAEWRAQDGSAGEVDEANAAAALGFDQVDELGLGEPQAAGSGVGRRH